MKIAIKAGPNAGQEHDLGGSVVVGRDPAAATLLIEDPEASRRHASLTPGASGVTVEDLGSTNGTYVNGERVEGAREAAAGDEIRIGNTVIEVQDAVETTRMAEAPVADPDATAMGAPVPGPPPAPAPSFDAPTPAPPPGPPAAPQAEPGAAEPPPWQPVGGPPAPASTPPPIPEPPAAPPLPAADFGPPPGAGQGYGAPPQQAYQGAPPPMGQPGGPMVPGGYTAASPLKTRESVVEWLLCYFVPFYSLFWFHRANKEIQEWSGGRIDYNAGSSLAAITVGWFILVPPFVAWASFIGRIRTAQQMAGVQPTANFWGSVGRMFLLGYGYKWHQDQFNEIAVRQPQG